MIFANPDQDETGFVELYLASMNSRDTNGSSLWLSNVLSHAWLHGVVGRVARKRQRQAPGVAFRDLIDVLLSSFSIQLAEDPMLGLKELNREKVPSRVLNRLDTIARHLFPREFQLPSHRPRKKPVVRHVLMSLENIERDTSDSSATPFELANRAERAGTIRMAMNQLTKEEQLVLTMRYEYEFSFATIGDELKMTKHRVAIVHKLAKDKLMLLLQPLDI